MAVLAVSLFAGVWCTWVVAQRIAEHQRVAGRVVHLFSPVIAPDFAFLGRPVRFEHREPSPDRPSDYGSVVLHFGEEHVTLPVPIEPRAHTADLPGLHPYEDWLRVLRFAPISGRTGEQFERDIASGVLAERVVVVTRRVRPGTDARTWGRVWKKDWVFDLYELTEAGLVHERFAYPQSRPYDEGAPELVGGVPQLTPDMWQYDASLLVMPEGTQPKIRAADSALRAAGWPFAGAVTSMLGVLVGAGLALAPANRARAAMRASPPAQG